MSSSSIRVTHLLPSTHLLYLPGDSLLSHLHAPASISGMGAHKGLAPDAGYHTLQELPLCHVRSSCWWGRLGAAVEKLTVAMTCLLLLPSLRRSPLAEEASSSFPPASQIHSFIGQLLCIIPLLCSRNYSRHWGDTREKRTEIPISQHLLREQSRSTKLSTKTFSHSSKWKPIFISCVNNRQL